MLTLNSFHISQTKTNALNLLGQSLLKKQALLPKRLINYMWKELNTPKRNSDVDDESIWSFIARRFEPDVADNLVDPLFKGYFFRFNTGKP